MSLACHAYATQWECKVTTISLRLFIDDSWYLLQWLRHIESRFQRKSVGHYLFYPRFRQMYHLLLLLLLQREEGHASVEDHPVFHTTRRIRPHLCYVTRGIHQGSTASQGKLAEFLNYLIQSLSNSGYIRNMF